MILLGHCWVNSSWSLFMNSVLSPYFLWCLELFWSIKVHNRCPGCNHHKDLEHPGMGQLGYDCKKLQKRQESSFLLTLAVQIGGVAVGQDP